MNYLQGGASDADLSILQRYRFEQTCCNGEKASARAGSMILIAPTSGNPANERVLLREDSNFFFNCNSMIYCEHCFLYESSSNHKFPSTCVNLLEQLLQKNFSIVMCETSTGN